MQLFLTVPVFAILYAWRPAAGWVAVAAGTIASLAGAAATTYKDDLVSAILTPSDIANPGDYQASGGTASCYHPPRAVAHRNRVPAPRSSA